MDDTELNAIRAARLAELQKNAGGAPSGPSVPKSSGADDIKTAVLSRILETSARERLSRVRIVRPERAEQVEQYITKLYQMGQITHKLGERDIVQILDGLARDQQKGGKIVFERKAVSDDEDDFFD